MTGKNILECGGEGGYRIGDLFRIPSTAPSFGSHFLRLAEDFGDGAFGADVLEQAGDVFTVGWVEVLGPELAVLERLPDLRGVVQGRA